MSAVNSHDTGIDGLPASPLGIRDEADDAHELDLATGDYTSRMEEVLGNESEEEDEDEGFLYQGADSFEASATYNQQLNAFLEGLDDDAGPPSDELEEEQQVEQVLNVYDEQHHKVCESSGSPHCLPNLCRPILRLIVLRRPHRCQIPIFSQDVLLTF